MKPAAVRAPQLRIKRRNQDDQQDVPGGQSNQHRPPIIPCHEERTRRSQKQRRRAPLGCGGHAGETCGNPPVRNVEFRRIRSRCGETGRAIKRKRKQCDDRGGKPAADAARIEQHRNDDAQQERERAATAYAPELIREFAPQQRHQRLYWPPVLK